MSIFEGTTAGVKTMADDTLRLTIDIEPRFAAEAFALFGVRGRSVAVTALKDGAGKQSDAPIVEKPKGGELAKLAGQWCDRRDFLDFIRPVYDRATGGNGSGWGDVTLLDFAGSAHSYCRHAILLLCDIQSRTELDYDRVAAAKFDSLIRLPFMNYLRAAERW